VLTVSEGFLDNTHSAFYDLCRVAEEKIAERWDTVEPTPPQIEWKNNSGKL